MSVSDRREDKVPRLFMIWVFYSGRSYLLSKAFNAKLYNINFLSKKTFIYALFRYFISIFYTIFILTSKRPKIIFLMNLPVFLPMTVYLYAKLFKCYYIIDSHSGLFNRKAWNIFLPIMKVIYKNCLINIAHNEKDAKIYQSWGVKSAILSTEVYPYDTYERVLLKTKNNVVVIGKFSDDEPYDQIILAAKNMDHVQFYFTGPIEKAKRKMDVNNLPKNVVLTGFLPQEEFIRLVKSVDVALALVTTAETMQMAAWEAMSCEVPIILSDWQLLRRTFPKGAIFVKNTQQSIVEGIQKFFANQELFQREISQLKAEKKILWDREVQKILAVITDIEQEQNKPQSLAPPRDVAPRP